MATETYWCPGPWPWQWFRTCTREVPDDPCNAPGCTDAKARLDDARRRINSICFGLRTLNALAKLLRTIVSTPIWIVIAMALIAAIVGGPIAVIIWSLIAVYGISWLLLIVVTRMAQSLVVSLADARTAFQSAVTDVVTQCPEHCWGDLAIPECRIE
jgi:hypothetical protein